MVVVVGVVCGFIETENAE